MKILLFFIAIIFIKFSLNFYNYLRTQQLHKYFDDFFHQKRNDMNIYRQEVISLFEKANIKDVKIPVSEPIGFGQICNVNVSVFDMFPSTRVAFASTALNMFEEAEGVFRKNMFDSINPLYWMELIVFFPKNILKYVGLNIETTAFKLWNIFLTFIWWSFCTVITLFQPEIKQFIIKLLAQF